jgi:hypothetical protein
MIDINKIYIEKEMTKKEIKTKNKQYIMHFIKLILEYIKTYVLIFIDVIGIIISLLIYGKYGNSDEPNLIFVSIITSIIASFIFGLIMSTIDFYNHYKKERYLIRMILIKYFRKIDIENKNIINCIHEIEFNQKKYDYFFTEENLNSLDKLINIFDECLMDINSQIVYHINFKNKFNNYLRRCFINFINVKYQKNSLSTQNNSYQHFLRKFYVYYKCKEDFFEKINYDNLLDHELQCCLNEKYISKIEENRACHFRYGFLPEIRDFDNNHACYYKFEPLVYINEFIDKYQW